MSSFLNLITVSRPIYWVNTAYPFAAAYVLSGSNINLMFIISTLFFIFPYNLLMYGINDVFDYESDKLNPRKNSAEGAVVSKTKQRFILTASVLMTLPFVVYMILNSSLISSVILLIALFFVVAYSIKGLRFKEIPVLDSFTSAMHFALPLLYGLSFAGFTGLGIIAFVSLTFWSMASHAFGAIQDITPDRSSGISSIATWLGAKKTAYFCVIFYGLSAITLLLNKSSAPMVIIPLIYLVNILPSIKLTDYNSNKANKYWRRFIYLNYVLGFVTTLYFIVLKSS